jgi:2-polyprenyl-3-methyl-5-hydroxy-6-metoxy-1,4-benzoquinol methylase
MDKTALAEARQHSAELSLGTSADPIYDCICRVLQNRSLEGSVLDFGAGKGLLTRRLARMASLSRVTGTDIMSRPGGLPDEIGWIQNDLNEPLPTPAESFDVIIAAEVIEHLENPRHMSREIFRLLRRGGVALVSTPNNESLRSLLSVMFRGHFVAFLDSSYPAHITPMLRLDLHRVLTEAGFKDVQFHFTGQGDIPRFTSKTWQDVSLGMLKGRLFSDNVIVSARKP